MALPEKHDDRIRCYRNALSNWRFDGYVEFKERVREWLKGKVRGRKLVAIKALMFEFVANGGTIDEQKETRSEFVSFEFHYDLRIKIDDRVVYFETILLCDQPDDPDDPRIQVVNIHDA